MKPIEVTIMGQSYRLMCPDDGEAALRLAVADVDREMSNIRDAGKVKARERIAVLAALNLAYRLAEVADTDAEVRIARNLKSNGVATAAGHGTAQGLANQASVSNDTIDRLVDRIDGVLGNDGLLL